MQIAANVVVGLIAAVHVYILVLEMFLWGRAVRVFGVPRDQRDNSLLRTMLQNQGVYNGFLAAGLIWGLLHPDPSFGMQLQLFFLGCVAVAGIVGAATANVRILFVQTIPAAVGLGLVLLAG
jgi:putative membrane protein